MFANLELFLQEKDVYRQKIEEIKSSTSSNEELEKRLAEAEETYKGQVRKYLSSAINVLNTTFQCQYSIYKVGKDFDVNFQVVETNVRKTRSEVISEMEAFKTQAASMTLTNEQITKINIAMEVLLTYSDDATDQVDENKEAFLSEAKVTATSIIETPTRESNAFEPAPSQELSFNPYANQPIEVDSGFKNPEYEKKTLVDPFASIYGGENVSPNAIPEATPDFGNPIPNTNFNNSVPATNPTDAMSIFGAGIATTSQQNSAPIENMQTFSNPMNSYENNGYNVSMNTPDSLASNSMSQISVNSNLGASNVSAPSTPGVGISPTNSYPTNSGNVDINSQVTTNQESETLVLSDEQKEKKETAFIISKIMKGIFRLPITTLLFLGIIVLIFWGLDKANLMDEITELLGEYMIYAEFALVLFIALIGSSTVLDAIATKTKYISKHAMTSLAFFSVATYGLVKLVPYLVNDVLVDMVDSEILLQVLVYFPYYLALSFFIGTFMWIFSFLRTDKKILKKKRLNIIEMIGCLWCVYTIIIPAVMLGCEWCNLPIVSEKVSVIYDYANCDWIMIIASFVLGLIMLLFSKIEEKKL